MKASALITDAGPAFSLEEISMPEPGPGDLVVRTTYSGVSIGTEMAVITGKLNWGPYPLCTGYQGVGVVESVGSSVVGYNIGDTVYYRDNKLGSLEDGRAISSVFGTHCSTVVIDPTTSHGIAHKPQGVPDEAASLFVMPAVGLNAVDMAQPRFEDTVVVHGCGPVGLGAVAACRHRGCRVIAIDIDDIKLQMATMLGADDVINGSTQDVAAAVTELIGGRMAEVVFEATGNPTCIEPATELCAGRGKFVYLGNYGGEAFSWKFLPAHLRVLTAFFPCNDGLAKCRRAVLRNMELGALDWSATITHRIEPTEAADFYANVAKNGSKGIVSPVIHWS